MNYYLVDYENIRGEGLKDLTGLKDGDSVIFFYSEQCKNITLDIIAGLVERNISFNCSKVSTGSKNALDFQLSSHLGYLIGKAEDKAKYYIVSKDKGFDCLCEYWKKHHITVERIESKSQETTKNETVKVQPEKKSKVKESDIATLEDIRGVLSAKDEPEEVLRLFNQFKTKQAIYNGISKYFKDSKRSGAIYKKLKPLLKEKNKS